MDLKCAKCGLAINTEEGTVVICEECEAPFCNVCTTVPLQGGGGYCVAHLPDDFNERYIFQTITSHLLRKIANGSIDAVKAAKEELGNRGHSII